MKLKRLAFEIKVSRTFTIEGDDYCQNWETFKRELGLLDATGRWEMPSKLDRGRDPDGRFQDERLSEHVVMREFTSHHDLVFYAAHDECPNCFCDDTLSFKLTADGTGLLDPMAECSNCGFKKLFCNEPKKSSKCKACGHRVACLVQS